MGREPFDHDLKRVVWLSKRGIDAGQASSAIHRDVVAHALIIVDLFYPKPCGKVFRPLGK
jgi:hypothetical protein